MTMQEQVSGAGHAGARPGSVHRARRTAARDAVYGPPPGFGGAADRRGSSVSARDPDGRRRA